ncbi:DExH-box ATP-dependent RNA helicase DExH7, chloroplastic isoform X2 [Typha angustifolia]|uniref:DExH-box ATP-dependent RNA helicase DExH7, chloroplastic isoform X2 n=1 Tax=Typha angustifolia TaxID=59011 RepID=UPI003C2C91FD
MAPKKRQQQQQQKSKSKSKSKPQNSDTKSAPKLQISAENERRLRRLLLNTELPPAEAPQPHSAAVDTESRSQKAKRLCKVYDKLSLEGFASDQIEKALSALNEGATFEAALDWLCFNLPGNELPLKFSSGATSSSHEGAEGSIKIISTAREDWVPPQHQPDEAEENVEGPSIIIRRRHDEISLDDGKASQAEWIRQYMEQQEDEEEEEDNPTSRAASVTEEYRLARLGALEAKKRGDKKSQKHFSSIVGKLKQELSMLGLLDEFMFSGLQEESTEINMEEMACDFTSSISSSIPVADKGDSQAAFEEFESKLIVTSSIDECPIMGKAEYADNNLDNNIGGASKNEEEVEELELDSLFSEDPSSSEVQHPDILKHQKTEKSLHNKFGHTLGNIDEIWKKGDSGKLPKAVLQKLCQRLSWEAPKYSKLSEKDDKFTYAVRILRGTTGRGKSRKAGGLTTIQLPDQEEAFGSVEDAQNRVAAFGLYQLFSDLPLNRLLVEPYASLVLKWQKDEFSTELVDNEDSRRAGFVNMLLKADDSKMTSIDTKNVAVAEKLLEPCVVRDTSSSSDKNISISSADAGPKSQESIFLKKELERKLKVSKYMKMLESRAALPIAKLKNHFLQMLKENDVIVVCGETGCGKTTQIPQFILDDMIASGLGGCCNIVCTQPRRLAAISVAERVSDERCESSPGCHGSLVGYQVRLESARNEKTKLLFCTTGILLRKLSANKNLDGVTHVIVDEVHERSLLGDFLLIVLKSLIEKQSCDGRRKLKVVLMSATVDSSLFSRYFGDCPVISAEGRTHPVSTYFLEDVYEQLNYILPLDSPASGTFMAPNKDKRASSSVDNRRGKKNLVLSSWGDDSLLSEEYVNPHYVPDHYKSYSERTRQNLKRLNEDVIDFDLLEDLICYIDENYPSGAILVFLPGIAEIDMFVDKLSASFRFGGVSSDWVLPLHSSLASTDQRKVFHSPPQNIRKVIIATDIAETSITIDDVVYVIDTGKHKENRYNPQKKMSSIVEDWISRANAKQRKGRAGRVKPGICFCFYTCHRFEILMRPFQVPEMLRMPLTELCLQIKSLSLGDIKSFLLKAMEPPREETISSAVDLLYKVGAFEGDEELSPLGYHLAKLPVDVLIGKMMLYGAIFGCLSPILSIAAFLSYKFPFVYPKDEKQNVEKAKSTLVNDSMDGAASNGDNKQSDHLLMVVAYNKWARILHENGAKSAQQFCRKFFLNNSVMYMIRDMRIQFGSLLADIGLVDLPEFIMNDGRRKDKLDSWFANISLPFNMYAHHSTIIKAIICAGLYPNVAATIEGIDSASLGGSKTFPDIISLKDRPLWYDGRREVHIHPSSINYSLKCFQYPFLVFLEKVETSKVFLRDTTIISPYSILLFGGSMAIQHQTGLVIIDGWLKLTAPAQTAVLFKELRRTLDAVLKELIRKPEMATCVDNEVVKSIIYLLLEEEKSQR